MADPSTSSPLTRSSVLEARELIRHLVHHTPTVRNATLDHIASTPRDVEGAAKPTIRLYFKCENLQRIGAFKIRGAFHALAKLLDEPGWVEGGGRERGVVTHSSGNHAQAVALAARTHGIPAHIVMPSISAPPKIAGTKGYGAKVIFSGSTSVEREAVVAKVIEETGARLVPPYDHPDIVLGQGTLGLELQEDARDIMIHDSSTSTSTSSAEQPFECGFRAPSTIPTVAGKKQQKGGLNAILTPCGGGGMTAGVALSCEGTGIKVFACEPSHEGADDGKRGYEAGKRVETVKSLTVADGLRTPIGKIPWEVIYERRLVNGFYNVSEEEIVKALRLVYERLKMVVEPSAVVPLAVVLFNEDFRRMVEEEAGEEGWDVGVVFSGGNVSLEALGKLFAKEEEKKR